MSTILPDDIPDHYRALLKDWLRVDLPPHINPHAIVLKCNIPPGSYFVTGGAMLLETQAYLDALKPLLAAEAIALVPPPLPAQEPSPVNIDDGD